MQEQFTAAQAARFWAKVEQRGPDDCWLWSGKASPVGYGRHTTNGVTEGAHRLAYRLTNGPIPDGLYVCHRCDVRMCCNPAHLFLGTCADNIRDMHAKGRASTRRATGTRHHNAKLTPETVRALRAEYATGAYTQKQVGRRYGVNQATVSQIIRREIWSEV